jgi:hypothetical protein
VGALLWLLAIAVMLATASYQRATGPTHPMRGTVAVGEGVLEYVLIRSGTSTEDARVEIPDPGDGVDATLAYRRYPTADTLSRVPFRVEAGVDAGVLTASLPRQPAAGKLEYHVELAGDKGVVRIPSSPEDDPIIRFKDPVPLSALVPHVLFMFFAILVGVRSGMAAAIGRRDARRYAWLALGLMSVGGMILGPIVQKFAFGAYWTGFPFGYDLTDNKTLIMWLVWLAAGAVLVVERRRGRGRDPVAPAGPAALAAPAGRTGRANRTSRPGRAGRVAIVMATAVMLAVYLIPHSMRGSELDYDRLDEGVDATEAIRTG